MASEPNWLIVVGLIYLALASCFLAMSASYRSARTDQQSRSATESRQRVSWAFAGVVGAIGFSMQTLGQFVHVRENTGMVLIVLGMIGILLGYIYVAERQAEMHRSMGRDQLQNPLKFVSHVASSFGEAAE